MSVKTVKADFGSEITPDRRKKSVGASRNSHGSLSIIKSIVAHLRLYDSKEGGIIQFVSVASFDRVK